MADDRAATRNESNNYRLEGNCLPDKIGLFCQIQVNLRKEFR